MADPQPLSRGARQRGCCGLDILPAAGEAEEGLAVGLGSSSDHLSYGRDTWG